MVVLAYICSDFTYSRFLHCTHVNCQLYVRNITIPVLPQGIQIMADQGFRYQPAIIVLPKANRPAFTPEMRKYVHNSISSITPSYSQQLNCGLQIFGCFYTKSFCIHFSGHSSHGGQ